MTAHELTKSGYSGFHLSASNVATPAPRLCPVSVSLYPLHTPWRASAITVLNCASISTALSHMPMCTVCVYTYMCTYMYNDCPELRVHKHCAFPHANVHSLRACMHTYMYADIYMYMYMCMCMYIYMWSALPHMLIYARPYACMHVCMYACMYVYACIHCLQVSTVTVVRVLIYSNRHTCIYMHTYIYIYIYTCIHTHTHIYIYILFSSSRSHTNNYFCAFMHILSTS